MVGLSQEGLMSKANIIILIIAGVLLIGASSFFVFVPKEAVIPVEEETVQDTEPVLKETKPKIEIREPEEIKRTEPEETTATDYVNFERTVDELILLTE